MMQLAPSRQYLPRARTTVAPVPALRRSPRSITPDSSIVLPPAKRVHKRSQIRVDEAVNTWMYLKDSISYILDFTDSLDAPSTIFWLP